MAYKAWALVDFLHHIAEPNPILTASDAEVFMVYSSSPSPERSAPTEAKWDSELRDGKLELR